MSNLSLLEEKLKQVSDRWQSLPLETREQQVEGMEFYSREVFPLIKQVFVARVAKD